MASNFLLKIDNITGESTVDGHVGEIEVSSCSFGFTNSGSMSMGTGGGSAKATLQDIHFTKAVDSSSNAIQKIGFGGTPPKTATLFVGKQGQGDKQVYYMKVTLEELIVSSFQVSGGGDGAQT